jgi:hypothetical protein
MGNKTFLGILMVFLLLSTRIQAQSGFIDKFLYDNVNPMNGSLEDFIVMPSGVKIFGKIQNKYDEATYQSLVFMADGQTSTYYPKDLKAFGLANSRFFMTKTVPGEVESKFVQILVSGELQLNFYNNRYFMDNGTELLELKAFYTLGQIDGNKLKRYVKAYISTLKIQMAGTCGTKLNDQIEKSKMEELDFVKLFEAYHQCNGLPYTSHINSISFLKVSPILMAGIGFVSLRDRSVEKDQKNGLDNTISYRFQGGLRLHDFRKFPRISLDLRLGVELLNTTYQSRFESPGVVIIRAEENFQETSIFIPIAVNYSFYRNNETDVYLGLSGAAWYRSISSTSGIITEELIGSGKTNIYNRKVVTGVNRLFVPGLKLGANFPLGDRMRLFTETQFDLLLDYYTTNILAKRSSFSRTGLSFQIGIEF